MDLKTFFRNIEIAAKLARAVNNPVRRKMIRYLSNHPGTQVSKLARRFKLPSSATSLHLAILRKAGLVQAQRQGRTNNYSVVEKRLKKLETVSGKMADGWQPFYKRAAFTSVK